MKVYNKLVRDRIPDIIRADGHIPQCETLDTARYLDALEQKLLEEAAEYRQTPCMEEMADLMEVIEAICKARGFDPAALQAVKLNRIPACLNIIRMTIPIFFIVHCNVYVTIIRMLRNHTSCNNICSHIITALICNSSPDFCKSGYIPYSN